MIEASTKNRNRLGPKCSCCSHPERKRLDEALIRGIPLRTIGKEFGISIAAIHGHREKHLKIGDQSAKQVEELHAPSELAGIKSQLPTRDEVGSALMSAVEKLQTLIDRNLNVNDTTALSGFGEARKTLETLSRLAGHLTPNQQQINVNVGVSIEGLGAELAKQMSALNTIDTRHVIDLTAVTDE
jgi:hypothetical protein